MQPTVIINTINGGNKGITLLQINTAKSGCRKKHIIIISVTLNVKMCSVHGQELTWASVFVRCCKQEVGPSHA